MSPAAEAFEQEPLRLIARLGLRPAALGDAVAFGKHAALLVAEKKGVRVKTLR
ncbi:MAG TPA: hypothetical protein VNP93_09520 [Gaiellaceae bacterium]|nr:hypothetical protein [Gaiellaceae bacterium]